MDHLHTLDLEKLFRLHRNAQQRAGLLPIANVKRKTLDWPRVHPEQQKSRPNSASTPSILVSGLANSLHCREQALQLGETPQVTVRFALGPQKQYPQWSTLRQIHMLSYRRP